MRPETAIALALLSLYEERGEEIGSREDIAERLRKLQSSNINLVGIRLRATPTGLTSGEVSEFVGKMIVTGLVTQESPIRVRPQAVDLLRRHLTETAESSPESAELNRAAEVLAVSTRLFARSTVTS